MKRYTFYTEDMKFSSVETKGERKYYVTGYISTSDRDRVNDIVSQKALSDMLNQLTNKNIKLDVEHEAWKDSPDLIPIGRITEARQDSKGIWVKAEINKDHSRFKEVWKSIKGGFLDAFSIAFQTIKATNKMIDGIKTRILEKVDLLNVALTGNPANPAAQLLSVITKSMEELEMAKEETKSEEPEAPAEEPKEESVEEPKVEEKNIVEIPEDFKKLQEELKSLAEEVKSIKESHKKEIEEKENEIKNLKEELKEPVIKGMEMKSIDNVQAEMKQDPKLNPLDILK